MMLPEGFAQEKRQKKQVFTETDKDGLVVWRERVVDFVENRYHKLTPEEVETLNDHGAEWKPTPKTHEHIGKFVCKFPEGRFYTNDTGGGDGGEGTAGTGGVVGGDTAQPDVGAVSKPAKRKTRRTASDN